METKDKENFNPWDGYYITRKLHSQLFYLTCLQCHHFIKLTEKNLKNIFIINKKLVLSEQQKSPQCESMLEIPNQTCWLSTKSSNSVLICKRNNPLSGRNKGQCTGNQPNLGQMVTDSSFILSIPHPPWHYRNRFRQHFWLPSNNPECKV